MAVMTFDDQHQVDPVIVDAIEHISYRFGASGLRDVIALAQQELAKTEAALQQLSDM
jgi:hypothetical protein